jgi:isopentenyl-diphosphate delta-isomerase
MIVVSEEQQIQELTKRVPPIVNVNIVIMREGEYLLGISRKSNRSRFPGSRMKYTERPEDTTLRVLETETPGVRANIKRIITVESDMGYDGRAYGVNIYYLLEYICGEPISNDSFKSFEWVTLDELMVREDVYEVEKSFMGKLVQAISFAQSNDDEILLEVTREDVPCGTISKQVAHNTNQRSHRAAHIVVHTSQNAIVLHQRSRHKSSHPLEWDIFGGHQQSTQSIDQCAQSELQEELGIDAPLEFLYKYHYLGKSQSEWRYIYLAQHDGPYNFDPHEVECIQEFDINELLKGGYSEYKMLPHVIECARELSERIKH